MNPLQMLLGIISRSKTFLQLTEALGINANDYVLVYSTQLQQPVKVKKSNVLFQTDSFIRADSVSGFPNTGSIERLYLENSTNKLYKWDEVAGAYKWLLEDELSALNTAIASKLPKGTYPGDAGDLKALIDEAVKFTPQTLTTAQKQQAQTNIGVNNFSNPLTAYQNALTS